MIDVNFGSGLDGRSDEPKTPQRDHRAVSRISKQLPRLQNIKLHRETGRCTYEIVRDDCDARSC
jgi:hypothetical protein